MAAKVDFVLNDIDGCVSNFKKPICYPGKQSLDEHMAILGRIRDFVESHPEVKFGVCTGRSLYLCDNIIAAAGFSGLSAVEMGAVVYDPVEKGTTLVLNEMKPELADVALCLKQFIQMTDSFWPEAERFFPNTGLKRIIDNTNMLTYEFGRGKLTGEALYDFLRIKMPSLLKKSVDAGVVKVIPSPIALDIRADIDKGHAVDYIFKRLGRTGKGCLGIGDAYHSDLDMMKRCEYVACPANSDENLKRYVSERGGYVAEASFGEGVLEIYHKFIGD